MNLSGTNGERHNGMLNTGATLDRTTPTAEAGLESLHGTPQALLDLLPVAVLICDMQSKLVRYNTRAAELLQCRASTRLLDTCCGDIHTVLLADGTPLRQEMSPLMLALANGTVTQAKPVLVERKDGSRIPVTVSATPLRAADGQIFGAVACYQDMSDRAALEEARRTEQALRESEQRFAATYENAGIAIAEVDAEGRLLRINEAYSIISGYNREELIGRSFSSLTHPDDRAQEEQLYAQLIKGNLDRYTVEKRHIGKSGKISWLAINASAVRGDGGAFLYAVRILRDITARKQAQQRQHMLMGELNHRIKNILTTVQSFAYQIIRQTSDPQIFFEKFQSRLIALGKAHSLLTRTQWEGASLRDIIEEQALPFQEGKGQLIQLDGNLVELSPEQAVVLGMVFHELLTNAVKHGSLSKPNGYVRIDWQRRQDANTRQSRLHLCWREINGPAVHRPDHQGFGSVFIERSVRDQLCGTAQLVFKPSGLVCLLELPLDR